jgi:hypothetical protein
MNPRVTRTELLAEIARRGYVRTARWHEDWIELGLLDRGDQNGPGAEYTWPRNQIELAALLLSKGEQVSRGALPKIVVAMWLWFGDEYVPFRQVPRAMKAWAKAEAEAPVYRVRRTARQLVDGIAHRLATRKPRLVRELSDFPASGDPEALREAFDDVFDPDRTGRERGPAGASLTTERYLTMLAARQRAIAKLAQYTQVQYEAARRLYVESRADYARLQPEFARDRELGHLHPPVDLDGLADATCADLLDCLAALYERREGTKQRARS